MQLIPRLSIRPATVIHLVSVLLMAAWFQPSCGAGLDLGRGDTLIGNDSVFRKHERILVIRPVVTISVGKERPPIMDFLEAEMTAGVDDDLFALLERSVHDSTRIVSRELRDSELYEDGKVDYVSPAVGCEKMNASSTFTARYAFVNMPMVRTNEPRGPGQVSELNAVFTCVDCSSGITVWQKSHTVFVPMKSASYQELMKRMFDHIVLEIPYRQ